MINSILAIVIFQYARVDTRVVGIVVYKPYQALKCSLCSRLDNKFLMIIRKDKIPFSHIRCLVLKTIMYPSIRCSQLSDLYRMVTFKCVGIGLSGQVVIITCHGIIRPKLTAVGKSFNRRLQGTELAL